MKAKINIHIEYVPESDVMSGDVHEHLTGLLSQAESMRMFDVSAGPFQARVDDMHFHVQVNGEEPFTYYPTPEISKLSDAELKAEIERVSEESKVTNRQWATFLRAHGRQHPHLSRIQLIQYTRKHNPALEEKGTILRHELYLLRNEAEHRKREMFK